MRAAEAGEAVSPRCSVLNSASMEYEDRHSGTLEEVKERGKAEVRTELKTFFFFFYKSSALI